MNALPMNRAGRPVLSFLSALGSVRETRLTATLAYLISRFPDKFLPLICGKEKGAFELSVEETDEGDRYDILLKGGRFPIILEAKVGPQQSNRQLLRYVKTMRNKYGRRPRLVIVDVGSHKAQGWSDETAALKGEVAGLDFVTWSEVADVCRRIKHLKKPFAEDRIAAAVAEDLLIHMEENLMTTNERPEVYLRDMSTPDSVDLYFRHHIYKCDEQFLRSARNNLYFAPYFTQATAKSLSDRNLVPIGEGITYISKIREVQVVPTKRVLEFLKSKDVDEPRKATELIHQKYRSRNVLLMLLGEPHMLFLSPVTKTKLSEHMPFGRGAMGSRSCSLEDLLAASKM